MSVHKTNHVPVYLRRTLNNVHVCIHKTNYSPVYLRRTLSMSVLAYWKSLLLELKMITAISQSHSTLSS